MKKLLISTIVLSSFIFGASKCQAATYDELVSQTKPSAVLIYADWADNAQSALNAFNSLQPAFAKRYGFTTINICNQEAKSFNKRNYIYPNLPYVLLLKERGRITRLISTDCLMNDSCIREKMDFFAN